VGIVDRQIALWHEGREETRMGLKELHELAYVMRDALEAGANDELGALLRVAFESKRRMNPSIAEHTSIDEMLTVAMAAGAMGGKVCGAGGGGCLLIYCRPPARASVTAELERLGGRPVPFHLHPAGVFAVRGPERWVPTP
jgi:D-glycero-alpha-D-manno-heptose-7-phosphate kinase